MDALRGVYQHYCRASWAVREPDKFLAHPFVQRCWCVLLAAFQAGKSPPNLEHRRSANPCATTGTQNIDKLSFSNKTMRARVWTLQTSVSLDRAEGAPAGGE